MGFKIALDPKGIPFKIRLGDNSVVRNLQKESLKQCLGVSEEDLEPIIASQEGLLKQVAYLLLLKNVNEAIEFIRPFGKSFKYNFKRYKELQALTIHHPLDVSRRTSSLYLTGIQIIFGIKEKVGAGHSSLVKAAYTLGKERLVRRVVNVSSPIYKMNKVDSKKDDILNVLNAHRKLIGVDGVIRRVDFSDYQKPNNESVVSIFFPAYDGTLSNILPQEFSDDFQNRFTEFLLSTLTEVNSRGIVHGDLQACNIFHKDSLSKFALGDFGCSVDMAAFKQDWIIHHIFKTPASPPEILQVPMERTFKEMDPYKLDVFPAGMLLFAVYTNESLPFWPIEQGIVSKESLKILMETMEKKISDSRLSDPKKGLLRNMLQINPEERPTMREALKYFRTYISKSQSLESEEKEENLQLNLKKGSTPGLWKGQENLNYRQIWSNLGLFGPPIIYTKRATSLLS